MKKLIIILILQASCLVNAKILSAEIIGTVRGFDEKNVKVQISKEKIISVKRKDILGGSKRLYVNQAVKVKIEPKNIKISQK